MLKMVKMPSNHTRRLAALGLALLMAACSGYRDARDAQIAEQKGDWDTAVLLYLELADQHPGNVSYRTGLLRAKIKASQMHFERGKDLYDAGVLDRAIEEYRQAVQLDPSNQYAQVELEKAIYAQARAQEDGSQPETLAEMKENMRGSRAQPPVLNPRSNEPISLSFPKPVSVTSIYRALGRAFGIDVLFDPKMREQEISIELEDATAQEALEILMRASGHFYKVLNEQSIIVIEDSPQNRRAYEDLVIQTFFLSNAEVKDVMTMLRSLVGAKSVAANDQLNAIALRDTADKVKVAESIIRTNDKSRGEVVVDVELLQINTSKLQELGVLLTDYTITQFLDPALQVGDSGAFRVSDLEFINQGDWLVSIPGFVYDFVKTSTEAQLLASPQVRISDGEQATVHIGEQVPIPVTTFNTSGTIGGNIVPITSFQYQDIGIRLDIQPRLHHNKEITLELKVEVSNISGFVTGVGDQQQPIIGTRRVESTIRLMDGETNFLAGLIRTDETVTDTGIPGLMDLPLIGRLFTHKKTDAKRTDLILTLTPHIIRTPNVDEEDLAPIWVGTEANITFRGGSPRVESEVEGPFDEGEDEDAERIREMIRRRIQNLPRGLQDSAGEGEAGAEELPESINLTPSAAPGDIFDGPVDRETGDGPLGDDPLDEPPPNDQASRSSLTGLTPTMLSVALQVEGDGQVEGAEKGPPKVELELQPPRPLVAPGAAFEVQLVASAKVPVSHLPVTLVFDPRVLEVIHVQRGGFLGSEGQARFMADSSSPGRIVLGASRVGQQPGVTGNGLVASLRFRALEAGQTSLSFEKGRALDKRLKPITPIGRAQAVVRVSGTAKRRDPAERPTRPDDSSPPPG
ncbi:MAG: secretin N-terminal domain-containing protein [Thermoanaerobaculia bacterium]